jgi:tungstate transport system permease protein
MDLFVEGIKQALYLLIELNREIFSIAWRTLLITGPSVLISLLIGIPLGVILGLIKFPGRKLLLSLIYTGMGFPPTVIGLFVAMFLWRSGPLGFLSLLYTPTAMVIAQVIIATPIVIGLILAAMQQLDPKLKLQALSLGANKLQLFWTLIKEARIPSLAAIMAAFGGIISEVGSAMIVGGNIKGRTRILTTAIVLFTRMGKFEKAIAVSIILLFLSFLANFALTYIQQRERIYWKR